MAQPTLFQVGFNAEVGGKNILAGTIISINLKSGPHFGVGSIWLSPEKYWAKIPDNLTSQEYNIIHNSLADGMIVEGKRFIPPIDKPSGVCEEYWFLMKAKGAGPEVVEKLRKLISKGIDRNYTATEIIRFCLDKEKLGKNRQKVTGLLDDGLGMCTGPAMLYEPPSDDEEGKVGVVISKEGVITDAQTKEVLNKPVVTAPLRSHTPGDADPSETLDALLG